MEVAIPLVSLGSDVIDKLGGETWNANFCRTMLAPQRKDGFSCVQPHSEGRVPSAGFVRCDRVWGVGGNGLADHPLAFSYICVERLP